MEMLVFGDRGYPVVIFPTTMGRHHESKDFHLIDSVKWFVEKGLIQIFCPDSIDKQSWYNKKVHPAVRVKNHICYDNMVMNEIVDRVRHNTATGKVAVAGASFGGYHATNFAFKHPERVSHLFNMSAAYDVKSFMNGYYDENVYFNNPMDFIGGLEHPELRKMKIVLGTSEWDICKEPNFELSKVLSQKGIRHTLDLRGQKKHDWPLWREMFPHYVSTIWN